MYAFILPFLLLFQVIGFTAQKKLEHPTIKIGFLGALSGPRSATGKQALKAFQDALEEENKRGGIGGRRFQVVTYDSTDSPLRVPSLFKKMKKDGIIALTGVFSGNEAVIAAKSAEQNRLPLILSSSPQTELTKNRLYVIRLCFNADREASQMVKFARGRLQTRHAVQVVDVSDSFSISMGDLFRRKYELDGGTVLQTFPIRKGERQFVNLIAELSAMDKKPDVIFSAASGAESDYLFAALASNQLNIPVLGNSNWSGSVFVSNGVVAYFPALGTAELSFDTGSYIVRALKEAASVEPRILMRSLRNNQINGKTGEIKIREGQDPVRPVPLFVFKKGRINPWVSE